MKEKYTLETHLEKCGRNNETAHSLESVYTLQKRKLQRYMASVVSTYPTYSTHDAWHSVNIVSAIENILGRDRIKRLSAIDTFLILMCAYMHDVGMLYTDQEVRELWSEPEFQSFLEKCEADGGAVGEAAEALRKGADIASENGLWALDAKQAVTIVMMEYFRPQHGERIVRMTDRENQIGELLRVEDSFLPLRIIKLINKISMAHTWSFERLSSDLEQTDTFHGEEMHPRLAAWLLRMGDLCDLDNDRFNKVGIATFGELKDENLAHYFKHLTVETLLIQPDRIYVTANIEKEPVRRECREEWLKDVFEKDRDEFDRRWRRVYEQTIREHISWKSWMEQEVRNAKLNVQAVFPKSWNRKIPEIRYRILVNQEEISSSNQDFKFSFSPEKAFRLIENISIYQDEGLIFVRELVQNAIDATKIQLWREVRDQLPGSGQTVTPFEIERRFPGIYQRYAIRLGVRYDNEKDEVDFCIADSGIGISEEEFRSFILKTGVSWKDREQYKEELADMPAWLRPTGAFGIGMHTVFSVTDEMKIETRSAQEAGANEITLRSGKKDGYAFCMKADGEISRGAKIRFRFHLTEAQKARYFENVDDDYLKKYDSEYERIITDSLTEYCLTPLFPVEVNDQPCVPALVVATWCNELNGAPANTVLGRTFVSDRYDYCFTYDYGGIVVYDKKRHYLTCWEGLAPTCMEDPSYGENSSDRIAFMGMAVKDAIQTRDNFLKLSWLDILVGDGETMIDAARMKLTWRARKEAEQTVGEMQRFAREMFFTLIQYQKEDKEAAAYRRFAREMAEGYLDRGRTFSDIWRETCVYKADVLPVRDSKKVRTLEPRIVTRMLFLGIVDRCMYLELRGMKERADTFLQAEKPELTTMRSFALLDRFLYQWKAEWRVSREVFTQPWFDNQILEILEHYCLLWIQAILQFYQKGINASDHSALFLWKDRVAEFLAAAFPMLSKWKRAAHKLKDAADMFQHYAGAEHAGRTDDGAMLRAVLLPGSAAAFGEWRYKGAYAGKAGLSLELAFPFAYLLTDIPSSDAMTMLETSVWKSCLQDSVYGLFDHGLCGAATLAELVDGTEISLDMRRKYLTYANCPFLQKLTLTGVQEKNGGYVCTYGIQNKAGGIRASKELEDRAYRHFWRRIENNPRHYRREYTSILCFHGFEELATEQNGYNAWLDLACNSHMIPAWDYLENIQSCMRICDEQGLGTDVEACLDRILSDGGCEAVVEHIWKKNTGGTDPAAKEQIRGRYLEFLRRILTVWVEQMPKG